MLREICILAILVLFSRFSYAQIDEPIVLGYFPSWSETWTTTDQNSILREVPSFVNYVFLSFAKPDLDYVQGSYDISQTGLNVPYDGCTLKESVSALSDKGIGVILSIGGETYWGDPNLYDNIDYQMIKDLVDDMGFAGIDWDYEPNGSFADIGNPTNVQHFIDFITNSRALMPATEGYLIACAPAGAGALGGVVNDDFASPYGFANRNALTGENDDNLYNGTVATNGINLFGFSATGHMIPVFAAVGDDIDIVAFQGYNTGGSLNRTIMYDAYAHYAEIHGFNVAAGVHFPEEPWGPFYTYTPEAVGEVADHIESHPIRAGSNDGLMIWQLLLSDASTSAYAYMNLASEVLGGTDPNNAIPIMNDWSVEEYTGGATGCTGNEGGQFCGTSAYDVTQSYPTPGMQVYADCAIWVNQWWANPGEAPGDNAVWLWVEECLEDPDCGDCPPGAILGCTDSTACNYDSVATCDDDSCLEYDLCGECGGNGTPGCTDPTALNYDPVAVCDDGSCQYAGCTYPNACNYNPTAVDDDGSCSFPGCMDSTAENYDPLAGCSAPCFYADGMLGDLNSDCIINTEDLLLMLTGFGSECE